MPHALIACDVFASEIERLRDPDRPAPAPVVLLEMGLHDHPDRLRRELQSAVDTLSAAPGVETILLAYGLCGRGLDGVRASRVPLVLPRAHDCISILLGGIPAHQAALREEPGTYFYSPGWIRGRRVPGPDRETHLRELYSARHPDDPEMVEDLVEIDRELFAHHRRAAYVDVTDDSAAESYCRDCARCLGWEFHRLKGDPSFLRALLNGPWDAARFVLVPPGRAIGVDSAGAPCLAPSP